MLDVQLPAPEIVLVDATVEDVYNALKQNGFDHLRGTWLTDGGGCVLGQAAMNLNVAASADVSDVSEESPDWVEYQGAWRQYALDEQLNSVGSLSKGDTWYPDEEYTQPLGIGDTIIYWNDKYVYKNGDIGTGVREYVLPTYDDVANMAYGILKPFFNETVKLLKYEYNNQVS